MEKLPRIPENADKLKEEASIEIVCAHIFNEKDMVSFLNENGYKTFSSNDKEAAKIVDDMEVYKNQKIYKDENLGIYIYPCEYFCPSWVCFGLDALTSKTVAIHWNQSSWWHLAKGKEYKEIKLLRYKSRIMRFIYRHSRIIAKFLTYPIFIKKWRKKIRKKILEKLGEK